jgi:hypothetical protein
VIRSAAGEGNILDEVLKEAEQVVVEELAAVVRVEFE